MYSQFLRKTKIFQREKITFSNACTKRYYQNVKQKLLKNMGYMQNHSEVEKINHRLVNWG